MASAQKYSNIGRAATPAEVKAWDIDVRSDFAGLPKGSGTVRQGEVLWEAQCASCHGIFGESNDVFTPIIGGTTKKDMETGRVAALLPGANTPQRTTMMKLSSLSTLWDYVNRAMPWTAPKSLKPDEVYALTAFMLNLAGVVPENFTLSDQNIREVQKRLPNRNGKTTAHAMWSPTYDRSGNAGFMKELQAKPDVQGSNCMTNCVTAPIVASFLPEYARNAHGNLAEQQRIVGAMRGADTTQASRSPIGSGPIPTASGSAKFPGAVATSAGLSVAAAGQSVPAPAAPIAPASPAAAQASASDKLVLKDIQQSLNQFACSACHGMENKMVGPSFKEIAQRYATRVDGQAYLAGKVKNGGQGVWGQIPMPAQAISEAEAARVAKWLMQGAAK